MKSPRRAKNYMLESCGRPKEIPICTFTTTYMSKKSKNGLRDSALELTMRDHATYPSTFLTTEAKTAEMPRHWFIIADWLARS